MASAVRGFSNSLKDKAYKFFMKTFSKRTKCTMIDFKFNDANSAAAAKGIQRQHYPVQIHSVGFLQTKQDEICKRAEA